jgi:pyruvyltransferase
MKSYWWQAKNFGDTLTPPIIEFLTGSKPELAGRNDTGKLLAVGSIMIALRENDVVWGTGWNKRYQINAPRGVKFLAVRGPITRKFISGAEIPEIYGDPGILLPLIYQPKKEKIFKIGYAPHYVDKPFIKKQPEDLLIDVQEDWKKVVDGITSCEKVIASSLHAVIVAEAYGVPVIWAKYSDKIVGGNMKYQDYFLGSGRKRQDYFKEIPPFEKLKEKQDDLIKAFYNYYGKKN